MPRQGRSTAFDSVHPLTTDLYVSHPSAILLCPRARQPENMAFKPALIVVDMQNDFCPPVSAAMSGQRRSLASLTTRKEWLISSLGWP